MCHSLQIIQSKSIPISLAAILRQFMEVKDILKCVLSLLVLLACHLLSEAYLFALRSSNSI